MTLVIFFAVVVIGIGVLSLLFAIERKRCPVCTRRAVAMRFTDGSSYDGVHIVSFHCKQCRAEFRTLNGGPLILRDAFDRGMREPVPHARVVQR